MAVKKKVVKKAKMVAAGAGGVQADDKAILVTRAGLEALKNELTYLEGTRRKEIAARIKEAVSYGDLSENSEYEEAKNEQAFVEGRILQLTEQLKHVQIIDDESAQNASKKQAYVQLGCKVKIRALSGKSAGVQLEYSLVGTTEADPLGGKISNESPVGLALLDKQVGAQVEVKAPAGVITYEILSIS